MVEFVLKFDSAIKVARCLKASIVAIVPQLYIEISVWWCTTAELLVNRMLSGWTTDI